MGSEQTSCEHSTWTSSPRAGSSAPLCPACGGLLVPLRNAWRCSRCYFYLCVGCEPETVTNSPDEE